ncbi:MAG: type I-G CRISPR-associated RAMP protein Csb1/Cas7g [Actinomycetota bacterium]
MASRIHPHRQLFDIDLEPISGERFQPAGFPDLGAALFDRPVRNGGGDRDWVKALLVESPQSMANHLERTAWPPGADEPVDTFRGLPYLRVVHVDDGAFLTSSRIEAHRVASAFVKDSELDGVAMRTVIRDRLQLHDDRPLEPSEIALAVLKMDPFALVHGVFFAEPATVWPGQPKVLRALTAFVEAIDVRRADSGGVKRDHVRHKLAEGEGGTSEGYGSVPFHRTEWTADRIIASFSLDLGQLGSYRLPEPATDLLAAIARWEMRSLLDGGLRLRTACDLVPLEDEIVDRAGEPLPPLDVIDAEVRQLVGECRELLDGGEPIEVVWSPKKAKS